MLIRGEGVGERAEVANALKGEKTYAAAAI
jgi:hypothetical protein